MRYLMLCCLCALMTAGAFAAGKVTLVKDGVSQTAIYVPAEIMAADKQLPPQPTVANTQEAQRRRLRESVRDLALYLGKISGAQIEIRKQAPAATDQLIPIMIGGYADKAFGGPRKTSPYKQGWRYVITPKGIGMMGESDEAVSYAVYELLDRLGCRWYMPGAEGEVIPRQQTISCSILDISQVPVTISRNIWFADEAFKRRNRLGGLRLDFGHALEIRNYITQKQLEEHPDWNAENNGKRSINGRFCWGNPEVANAVADGIITQLDKDYQPTVSIFPNDGADFCQCAKCKALDAGDWDATMNQVSITDRFIHFANQIAKRVNAKYPDVLLGFCPYVQYTPAPLREKPDPHLVPVIAPITYCRAHSMLDKDCPYRSALLPVVKGWGKVTKNLGMYEFAYNLAECSVPDPMMVKWGQELPVMYANGLKFWLPETMANFDTTLPGLYLGIRMSWNPNMKPQEVFDELFTRFYGAAAKPMQRYWQTFDDAWTKVPEHAGCAFSYGRRFTPEVMTAARKAMDEALTVAKTPMERYRVQMANDALQEFELFMALRHDLFEGRLAGLDEKTNRWVDTMSVLAEKYRANSGFTVADWAWKKSISDQWFRAFYYEMNMDAGRIAKDFVLLPPVLRSWRYQVDKENAGEAKGWSKVDTGDAAWKTTDPSIDTWASLGLMNYYGAMWYRTKVNVPALPDGKKVYLWISGTDGSCKVFVNSQPISYIDSKGVKSPQADGFCNPFSFDITAAFKPGADNQITIIGTRMTLNELGTGGLLGPVMLYREK